MKVRKVIKAVCFCMVAILMINGLNDLFKPKWLENRWQSSKTNNSFYDLEKNSTEVLFFGPSLIAASVDPFQLYENYGISSYNMGVMSQPMLATYFWFKEAMKTQDMKVAVIEIKSAARASEKAEEKARKSYDYMKDGITKLEYALEYTKIHKDYSLWDYLFPLSIYHSRWSELSYDDYDFFLGNDNSYTRGFATLTTQFKDSSSFNNEKYEKGKYDGIEIDTDEVAEVNEVNQTYLKKIISLAKEKNIELLFVKTPDLKWNTEQHNYIQNIADENDISFLDFNLKSLREEIDFNYITDAADTIHLNTIGAKKITEYLGSYLTKNFDLTDYREGESSIKDTYESELSNYQSVLDATNLDYLTNAEDYLKAINNDDYAVIMVAGSSAKKADFTDEQKKLLIELGADSAMFEESENGVNIIAVKDGDSKANKFKFQNSDLSKSVSLNGNLSDGTSYMISANATGCSVRLNDSECENVDSEYFNIIVYNKKINQVADTAYLYTSGSNLVIGR